MLGGDVTDDDDVAAARYELIDDVLSAAGLRWYEVSNWAQPGHRCRHNQLYWDQGDYRGIGCAAHSHRAGRRWWNIRTPERYIGAVTAGRDPTAGVEVLTDHPYAWVFFVVFILVSTFVVLNLFTAVVVVTTVWLLDVFGTVGGMLGIDWEWLSSPLF